MKTDQRISDLAGMLRAVLHDRHSIVHDLRVKVEHHAKRGVLLVEARPFSANDPRPVEHFEIRIVRRRGPR